MKQEKTHYICSDCKAVFPKWYGKCPNCGEWNTLEEAQAVAPSVTKAKKTFDAVAPHASCAAHIDSIDITDSIRFPTGMREFDRVLGGGIVEGSAVLISGEPGIGKSTLLLQICSRVSECGKVLYVSGEESLSQIKLRAGRLGVKGQDILLLSETNINKIIPEINAVKPKVVIIDSIQTMYDDELPSSPGSVTQVKQCAMLLMQCAKEDNISVMMVGHVNKDGAVAGPKVLEHIVDAVLYFEGDKQHAYRIIRAEKNRFGSTNEIGVFEMGSEGLEEIENISAMLLSQRPRNVSGSCAVCLMEGTRPVLAEIQALVTPTVYPSAKRMSMGIDYNRTSLVLAVMEKRFGYRFSQLDVYVNVAGGLRVEEPSGDLALALALMSSYKDIPVPDDVVVFGEVGLAGECRAVSHVEARLNEAVRLGFHKIALPYRSVSKVHSLPDGVSVVSARSIFDLQSLLGI
ncbi:MAG TPA: DNA repair protein RadA [Bacillota bacterium]|nr:DNA repair protein RadA [Bacillota bacterium]